MCLLWELAMTSAPACSGSGRTAANWSTLGGVLAALGICASCCLLPMILIAIGAGSAWTGTLQAFAPFKWFFIFAALGLLAFAFHAVYRVKPTCGKESCATCRPGRTVRVSLWVPTVLALASIVFDYMEPLLV
jgi:mercuric ion transport protein